MRIDQNELFIWDFAQEQLKIQNLFGAKREVKDPKKGKSYEYNRKKKRYIHWYKKEHSWAKRTYQKKFRQKWRIEKKNGSWYRPVNKEYHTYGYLPW